MNWPRPENARAASGEFTSAWNRLIRRFSRSWFAADRSDGSRYGTRAIHPSFVSPSVHHPLHRHEHHASLHEQESIDDDAKRQGSRWTTPAGNTVLAGGGNDRVDHLPPGDERHHAGNQHGE